MSDLFRVTICDGKYTFVQRSDGSSYSNRDSEEWRCTTGDGLVLGLAQEVDTLRELLSKMMDGSSNGVLCQQEDETIDQVLIILDTYRKDN